MSAESTRTLIRGLNAIEVLAVSETPLGPTAVGASLGVGKATASRLLRTLETAGYAHRTENGEYLLTEKMYGLVSECHLSQDLRGVADAYLRALRDATGETVHLGILDNQRIVVIDRFESTHPVRLDTPIGHTCPLHCTGLGKAALAYLPEDAKVELVQRLDFLGGSAMSHANPSTLLADLAEVSERGYAIDDRESAEHAYCVAAPVLVASGDLVAVISISGPSYRMTEQSDVLGQRCRQVAENVAHAFGRTVAPVR